MWIHNWCWWEGWTSFSKIVRHNLKLLPKYKEDQWLLFWKSVEDDVCNPHDEDFYNWGFIYAYIKANSIFTYRFCRKLWWTNKLVQIISFPIMFIWMNIFWVKYFNWNLKIFNYEIISWNKSSDEK